MFRVPAGLAATFGAERMWCEVTARDGDRYRGKLLGKPRTDGWLASGAIIEFDARHVAGVELGETAAMAPLVGCGLGVLRGGAWPTWIVRVAPVHERDSGWRVFARDGDHLRGVSASNLTRAWAVVDSVIDPRQSGGWGWDPGELEFCRSEHLPPR